jgi:Fur family transcriptional regulator, ferric uptake regulator
MRECPVSCLNIRHGCLQIKNNPPKKNIFLDFNKPCAINRNHFYLKDESMEKHVQALKAHKFKITPRRKAVIELFKNSPMRMGVYEVYKKLKHKLPTLGLPTVYRILDEFSQAGILIQSLSKNRQLSYLRCDQQEHHHHFTCRKCRKVEEVDYCNIQGVSRFIEKNLDAKVEAHQLQIEGLCSKCK